MKNVLEKIHTSHFEEILGNEIYNHWLEILAKLVPHGRTQRLSVFVASLLQYLWTKAQNKNENPIFQALQYACENYGSEESEHIVVAIIEIIFRDANVRSNRSDSKGRGYSIAKSAADEFFNWSNMPWE